MKKLLLLLFLAVPAESGVIIVQPPVTGSNLPDGSSNYVQTNPTAQQSTTNPASLQFIVYSNGYGDILNLYQIQYAGNYGGYLLYQQGNAVIWKTGSDMYNSTCSDGLSNCLNQPYIIKDRSLSPVFSFDQNHRMSAGKTWTPGINFFNFNGNMALGNWVDTDTAPVNGMMVSGNVILGATNAHALSSITQVEIDGSASNTYSLTASTATVLYHLMVSTSGHVITGGPTPTVSSCGTNPSVSGDDNDGTIMIGAGVAVTACTLTFASTWGVTPICVFDADSSTIGSGPTSKSATAVTIGFSAGLGSGSVEYHCRCSGVNCR